MIVISICCFWVPVVLDPETFFFFNFGRSFITEILKIRTNFPWNKNGVDPKMGLYRLISACMWNMFVCLTKAFFFFFHVSFLALWFLVAAVLCRRVDLQLSWLCLPLLCLELWCVVNDSFMW